jgi:hypothetical protein
MRFSCRPINVVSCRDVKASLTEAFRKTARSAKEIDDPIPLDLS